MDTQGRPQAEFRHGGGQENFTGHSPSRRKVVFSAEFLYTDPGSDWKECVGLECYGPGSTHIRRVSLCKWHVHVLCFGEEEPYYELETLCPIHDRFGGLSAPEGRIAAHVSVRSLQGHRPLTPSLTEKVLSSLSLTSYVPSTPLEEKKSLILILRISHTCGHCVPWFDLKVGVRAPAITLFLEWVVSDTNRGVGLI